MSASNLPLRFDLEVPADGRLELPIPLPAGSHVTVFVTEQSVSEFGDLLSASVSSTEFWDNSFDDEDWNDA
jgi:hypothetical protein